MKKFVALVALLLVLACAPVQKQESMPPVVPVVQAPVERMEEIVQPEKMEAPVVVETPEQPVEQMEKPAVETMPAGKTIEMEIKTFAFTQPELKIKVGDTVVWTNMDTAGHTVTSTDVKGDRFDSGILRKGQKFSHTFNIPGTYSYKCSPHPAMRGKVIVE